MHDAQPTRSAWLWSRRWEIVGGLALVALSAAIYSTVYPRKFVSWDDEDLIVKNGAVTWLTLTNLVYMSTRHIGGNYIPLTWLSFAIDWRLWGESAWCFGLTNVLLHSACCLLLVACLRRGGLTPAAAWLAGALFAVHPVHPENVAWVSGRKDLLCSVALLACQFTYMGWRSTGRQSSWSWSLVWLIIAGLSKPMAMSAVAALWLYDVLWLRRGIVDALRASAAHAVICLAVAAIASYSQHSAAAIAIDADRRLGALDLVGCTLLYQLARCWIPAPFSTFYPVSFLADLSPVILWSATAALIAASAGIALCAWRNRASRALAWWWFGSLAFLLPVSGIVTLGSTSLADRYLYLPSIGPCVFVARGIWWLAQRAPVGAYAGATLVIFGLAVVAHQRALAWRDSVTLWERACEAFPRNGAMWTHLSLAWHDVRRYGKAAEVAKKGLEFAPDSLSTIVAAAVALRQLDQVPEAEKLLTEAERIFPGEAELLNQRAKIAAKQQRLSDARDLLYAARDKRPDWWEPNFSLSSILVATREVPAAIEAARRSVELAPATRNRLAELLIQNGELDEALQVSEDWTAMFPHFAESWRTRVRLLRALGRTDEARRVAREAEGYVPPERLKL
jgi:tetratricopeptide (TPR) repeat protein